MAKISELTSITSFDGTEETPLTKDGTNWKASLAALKEYFKDSTVALFDEIVDAATIVSGTPSEESGATFSVVYVVSAGTFAMRKTLSGSSSYYDTWDTVGEYVQDSSARTDKVFYCLATDKFYRYTGTKLIMSYVPSSSAPLKFYTSLDMTSESTWAYVNNKVYSEKDGYRVCYDTASNAFVYCGTWSGSTPSIDLYAYPNFHIDELGIASEMYAYKPYVEQKFVDENNATWKWNSTGTAIVKVSDVSGFLVMTEDEYDALVESGDIDSTITYLITE